MIRSGDTIENPVTGERLVFTATSAETGGEYVRFTCFVEPFRHAGPPTRAAAR